MDCGIHRDCYGCHLMFLLFISTKHEVLYLKYFLTEEEDEKKELRALKPILAAFDHFRKSQESSGQVYMYVLGLSSVETVI